jgi:hypothetical protein
MLSGGRAELIFEFLDSFIAMRRVSGNNLLSLADIATKLQPAVRKSGAEKFGNWLDAGNSGDESKFIRI